MSANTSRQDLCPICKEEIEIFKNNWGAIQWKGVKGINDYSVKPQYDIVTEAGTKVHKHVGSSTQMIQTLMVILQSKVVVLYKREPHGNQLKV